MRGKLDLLMSKQDNNDSSELLKALREQRDKAVSESEGLKGQVRRVVDAWSAAADGGAEVVLFVTLVMVVLVWQQRRCMWQERREGGT
jgi:hypothetical protein